MKFIDEAIVKVKAGNGGRRARSAFAARNSYRSVVPMAETAVRAEASGCARSKASTRSSTIASNAPFVAATASPAAGTDCTGRGGDDLFVPMPIGTIVIDDETGETLGDLSKAGQTLLVAKGGKGGWGNQRFKSSTNRTPRQSGPGLPGEARALRVELRLLADVGLLGLPNAGKSTLIRAVSAARPKVADYPFTTLHPQLGVVAVGPLKSFVMADIPGLIEGAAEGAGLGIRFLKHLQRTRVLLHLVDIAPLDPDADPVEGARAIVKELKKFSPELAKKKRWLVLNKIDLLSGEELENRCTEIVRRLRYKGPVFRISGATGAGTRGALPGGNERTRELKGRVPFSSYFADIALTWLASRLLCRAALLGWMIPLRAIESMTGEAAFSAAAASSFLPARIASRTLRTALRTFER